MAPEDDQPHEHATWERLIDRQRRENEGLRSAMRYRAVIEQAKGVLMARSGSDPETAFKHLVSHSQRANLKLTQVAAAVVARTITTPPAVTGPTPSDVELLEAATGNEATRHLTAAAVVSAPDLHELLSTVVQYARDFGVAAGSLALAEPDGALRLAGFHGTEVQAVSGWKRIPPGTDLPMCAAAASRTALWFADAEERVRRFPGSRRYPGHREACAVLPLLVDRQLVGVLCLDWDEPYTFDEAVCERLMAMADVCSAPIADLLRRYDEPLPGVDFEPGRAGWFRSFLDSIPAPAVVLQPEFDAGRLVDLGVLFRNREAREGSPLLVGKSLFEMRPELVDSPFAAHAEAALKTGEPRSEAAVELTPLDGGVEILRDVYLFRVGTLLTVSWRQPKS